MRSCLAADEIFVVVCVCVCEFHSPCRLIPPPPLSQQTETYWQNIFDDLGTGARSATRATLPERRKCRHYSERYAVWAVATLTCLKNLTEGSISNRSISPSLALLHLSSKPTLVFTNHVYHLAL